MRRFLIALTVSTLLLSGCGSEKAAEPIAAPAKVAEQNFFGNGQYKVDTDIQAGEYLAVGTGYVEVASSSDGNANNILMNDNIENARRYVDLRSGEYLKVMGAIKIYNLKDAPEMNSSDILPDGQYKIGTDIKAGEYRINLETSGYYALTGTPRRDYIKNQFSPEGGNFYVTAVDGQYLQIKNGTAEFVGEATSKPIVVTPQSAKVTNLGMTFEQFKANYNEKIATMASETNWDVSDLTLTIGEQKDVFVWKIGERVAMMGTIEKITGKIVDVVVMSKPKNETDASMALLAYCLVIATFNPELNIEQRSILLDELKLTADKISTLQQKENVAVRGAVRYSTNYVSAIGAYHFFASAKDFQVLHSQ